MIQAVSDLVGQFGVPGAVASVAVAFWAGAKGVLALKNSNGRGAETRGWMKATLERNTECLERLEPAIREMSDVLHEVAEMSDILHEVAQQLRESSAK